MYVKKENKKNHKKFTYRKSYKMLEYYHSKYNDEVANYE